LIFPSRTFFRIPFDEDINKCAQGLTLEDSIDRDRWKKLIEAAKVLQGQLKLRKKKNIDSSIYRYGENIIANEIKKIKILSVFFTYNILYVCPVPKINSL
jgi:hypothetical protein